MLIFTAKLNRKKLMAAVVLVAVALGALIWWTPDREAAVFGRQTAGSGLKTNEDRVAFVQSLGYQVEQQPLRSQQVMIPHQFDQVYQQYNQLQKQCGFDLEPYQGKTLTLYTYQVTNYPGEQQVMLDLLVCKQKAVGGAVYSAALDGFMYGLAPAE